MSKYTILSPSAIRKLDAPSRAIESSNRDTALTLRYVLRTSRQESYYKLVGRRMNSLSSLFYLWQTFSEQTKRVFSRDTQTEDIDEFIHWLCTPPIEFYAP